MTAGLALGMPRLMLGAGPRPVGPNDAVNVAVIGLGSTTAVGGVGGRGHQLIGRLREIPGVKIVALCDAARAHLDRELESVLRVCEVNDCILEGFRLLAAHTLQCKSKTSVSQVYYCQG